MEVKDIVDGLVEDNMVKVPDNMVKVPVTDRTGTHERLAEIVQHVRYSDEDKARWAKLIKDFNALYHAMGVQTWNITRWRGVSVLKPPTDMWIYQELINEIKPDLIIEAGSYQGGSALFMRDVLNLVYPQGRIISIDVDHGGIQDIARVSGIEFYLGSSVADETLIHVKAYIAAYKCERVMVILDSEHTYDHVTKELELYAPLVTIGSILIIEDTSNVPAVLDAVNSWSLRHSEADFKKNLMGERFMLTFCRDGFWEKIA
jgi:cephalosporin hydroxylase